MLGGSEPETHDSAWGVWESNAPHATTTAHHTTETTHFSTQHYYPTATAHHTTATAYHATLPRITRSPAQNPGHYDGIAASFDRISSIKEGRTIARPIVFSHPNK